jgi:hypothetical protein
MAGLSRAGTFTSSEALNQVRIEGIGEFLRDLSKTYPEFNKQARIASQGVAELLVVAAKFEAASVTRNRQAMEVMKGMRAQRDRIPTIKLQMSSGFVSQSKPNRKRKVKVTRGDVFFGAEFGGGKYGKSNRTAAGSRAFLKNDGTRKGGGTTTQFLPWQGNKGYFFWPAVRKNKDNIARVYLDAIDEVLKGLEDKS